MARASTPTLLSLDRWAAILGISPAHFNQAQIFGTGGNEIFPLGNACSNLYFQFSWQNADSVSREDVDRAIYDTEKDIAKYLKYSVAPIWVTNEVHTYPRNHYRGVYGNGLNVRGQMKSINLRNKKFIQAGRRATTLIGDSAVVAYTDPDGDGFSELATVSVATVLTDACEIKIYFENQNAMPEWEIREPRTKVISGGVFTATFDSWLFIDPDLWDQFPTNDLNPPVITINDNSQFVVNVDIYREFTDFEQVSAQFFWERLPVRNVNQVFCCSSCGGVGCEVCTLITQDGCLHVRNVELGIGIPTPGTFNATTSIWDGVIWAECREPDQVKLWYYAGELDERFLSDQTCQPLSNYWAQTIAWMSVARLERPFCTCGNVTALANWLRTDLAFTGTDTAFQVDLNLLSNPFGTKRGEIMAWQRVDKLENKIFEGRAI